MKKETLSESYGSWELLNNSYPEKPDWATHVKFDMIASEEYIITYADYEYAYEDRLNGYSSFKRIDTSLDQPWQQTKSYDWIYNMVLLAILMVLLSYLALK